MTEGQRMSEQRNMQPDAQTPSLRDADNLMDGES